MKLWTLVFAWLIKRLINSNILKNLLFVFSWNVLARKCSAIKARVTVTKIEKKCLWCEIYFFQTIYRSDFVFHIMIGLHHFYYSIRSVGKSFVWLIWGLSEGTSGLYGCLMCGPLRARLHDLHELPARLRRQFCCRYRMNSPACNLQTVYAKNQMLMPR